MWIAIGVVWLVLFALLFNYGAGEGGERYDEASARYAEQERGRR